MATRVKVNPDSARALAARSPGPVSSSATVSLAFIKSGHHLDFFKPHSFNSLYWRIPRVLARDKSPCDLRLLCCRNEFKLRLFRRSFDVQGRDDGVNLVSLECLGGFLNIVIIDSHKFDSIRRSPRGNLLPQSAHKHRADVSCVSYLSTENNWVPTGDNKLIHNGPPHITSATRYCDDNHIEKGTTIRRRTLRVEMEHCLGDEWYVRAFQRSSTVYNLKVGGLVNEIQL